MSKPLRRCRLCELEANTEADLNMFVSDSKSKHGKANCCLECRRNEYSKYEAENKNKRTVEKKEQMWEHTLKSKYGINKEEYNTMLEEQDFSCKICNAHIAELDRKLYVDHCHTTGKVRGLLCITCNTGIGMLKDDIEILENAIKYLKETN